ncbi:MAG: hypothetical protein WC528_04590 [Patescibacteria group bacterium]
MKSSNELLQEFINADAVNDNIALSKAPSSIWDNKGKENVLRVFQVASQTVPAYKDFLKKNNIDSDKVRSLSDFQQLPLTDKENYLMKYPLNKLCINGDISKAGVISSSSGSTGKPFYWPRVLEQDLGIAKTLELLYVNNFSINSKSTLLLVCLGLGVWTAGEMMLSSGKMIAQKGHKFSVMCPGINLPETIKLLKNVAPLYEQTYITGYPAFVKDIIDMAIKERIDLEPLSLKVLVGGEVFTEEWREYIYENAKMTNKYNDITSVLGSSEGGIVGVETPLCVFIRKKCFESKTINISFFNSKNLPSVVQYNPGAKYFETVNESLVFTNLGGLPLIRYNTKDKGGLFSFDDVIKKLKANGISADTIKNELGNISQWTFPFAYILGRGNLMATIYAVNIYPENIKPVLFDKEFKNFVTGRFAMRTSETDKERDQYLEIFIELAPKEESNNALCSKLEISILNHIKEVNSEFNKLCSSINRQDLIKIRLKSFQDKNYFSSDKQKFVLLK